MDQTAPHWRTSSYTNANSNNCVEVADTPDVSAVRDSQHRHHTTLTFPHAEWHAFLTAIPHF